MYFPEIQEVKNYEKNDRNTLARKRRPGCKDSCPPAGRRGIQYRNARTAYDRISENEIRVHSNIYEPDFVAVVDDTLLHSVDVTRGLKEDGAILINTNRDKEQILPLLNGYKGRVYVLDAYKVCMATLGKYFPNTPMLAAMVKISEVMDKDIFLTEMEGSLKHKFARKPEVLDGNMAALRMAFEEVQ
jgi:pyruvate ferredoxin oxidoreductase gamma subunit